MPNNINLNILTINIYKNILKIILKMADKEKSFLNQKTERSKEKEKKPKEQKKN